MIFEIPPEIWQILFPFLIINLAPLVGFYFTTRSKLKQYEEDIRDLKKSDINIRIELRSDIKNLNDKLDKFLFELNKKH